MNNLFEYAAVPYQRPIETQRRFISPSVEKAVAQVNHMARPEIAQVFMRALPMTLDTAVTVRDFEGNPDTFLITGDIPAMWPRDATNSVWAYLPMLRKDPAVRRVVEGVLRREVACIRLDPYANAFYDFRFGPSDEDRENPAIHRHADDQTDMKPQLHERKYELDTLGALLRLSVGYHAAGGDTGVFDADWVDAIRLLVRTIVDQQAGSDEEDASPEGPPYTFRRKTHQSSDTLILHGRGQPTKRCGLSKSHFRPSDDAAHLPYSIPANAMAAVGLKGVAGILTSLNLDTALAEECSRLSAELTHAIETQGVVEHPQAGRVYAYEVDGFGNAYHMDDANVPNLLSLPYIGYCGTDNDTYKRSRTLLWSDKNPYYAHGKAASGVGGPHIGRSNIWPMSILMYALTTSEESEIDWAIRTVCNTHGGRYVMHESFHKDSPEDYTRPWFCWPNALFAELVLKVCEKYPHLLK